MRQKVKNALDVLDTVVERINDPLVLEAVEVVRVEIERLETVETNLRHSISKLRDPVMG